MSDQRESYPGKSAYRGEIASRYDEDRVVESIWAHEQNFVFTWAKSLPVGKKILDVPAGTGRFLEFFHRHGLRVTAVDVSADMVAEIRRRYPDTAKEIAVAVGDAERLDIPDNELDYVISWRFFHLIPATVIDRVLREFRRVCRGTVVVQVFGVQPSFWRRFAHAIKRRFFRPPTVAGSQPQLASPWAHIESFSHREGDLRQHFKKAGFIVVKASTLEVQEGRANRVYFLRRAP